MFVSSFVYIVPGLRDSLYHRHRCLATPFQSFMLGAGHATSVGVWTRSFPLPTRLTSHEVLNPNGRKAWHQDGPTNGHCIWEMHGVWGWDRQKDEGIVLRENYFVNHPMTKKKVRICCFGLQKVIRIDRPRSTDRLVHRLLLSFLEPLGEHSQSSIG